MLVWRIAGGAHEQKLDYDEKLGGYRVDITDEQLKNAPKIEHGEAGSERTGTATRRSMVIGGNPHRLSADVRQFEGAKVCRGSFSSGFGTASMCAAATLLLGGSAVIAESVFRFRSIRRSLRLASVTLAGRRVGAV